MHTNYNKISARERDSAPRFYYKRTQKITCIQRIKNFIRRLIAFFFSQIGICALVAGYMVMGAFLFEHLEAESQMEHAVSRNNFLFLILQYSKLSIAPEDQLYWFLSNVDQGSNISRKLHFRGLGHYLLLQHPKWGGLDKRDEWTFV